MSLDKTNNIERMTDEELEIVYANNNAVDWYICNLIRAEQQRRRKANTVPDGTGFSLDDGIKSQGF